VIKLKKKHSKTNKDQSEEGGVQLKEKTNGMTTLNFG
jgi:hypothetical protein